MRQTLAPLLVAALGLIPLPVAAENGALPPPSAAPQIAALDWGVFCAGQAMDRAPAPGTETGWIHVPLAEVRFHWPDRQIVPAMLGMGFGVQATGVTGWASAVGEVRVYRPGRAEPERWASDVSDAGATLAFFRFDRPDELVPGVWIFEGWDRDQRLYRVEFEVVPASAVPELTGACDATS